MTKIFIICSVRDATQEERDLLESYTKVMEQEGHKVHLPLRDTEQEATELAICAQNADAIREADEVHIFYTSKSIGSHFDMGVAFGLNKTIRVIRNEEYGESKSFARMLSEWQTRNTNG